MKASWSGIALNTIGAGEFVLRVRASWLVAAVALGLLAGCGSDENSDQDNFGKSRVESEKRFERPMYSPATVFELKQRIQALPYVVDVKTTARDESKRIMHGVASQPDGTQVKFAFRFSHKGTPLRQYFTAEDQPEFHSEHLPGVGELAFSSKDVGNEDKSSQIYVDLLHAACLSFRGDKCPLPG